jgi:heme-degrading monooxygenase HmoA
MELLNLLNQIRSTAVNQMGYISGETLVSQDDPRKVVVMATWDSATHWEKWKTDPLRKKYDERMENLLLEPPRYEVFSLGSLPR